MNVMKHLKLKHFERFFTNGRSKKIFWNDF